MLGSFLQRPVIDHTGLTGYYDFDLKWSAPEPSGGQPERPGFGAEGQAPAHFECAGPAWIAPDADNGSCGLLGGGPRRAADRELIWTDVVKLSRTGRGQLEGALSKGRRWNRSYGRHPSLQIVDLHKFVRPDDRLTDSTWLQLVGVRDQVRRSGAPCFPDGGRAADAHTKRKSKIGPDPYQQLGVEIIYSPAVREPRAAPSEIADGDVATVRRRKLPVLLCTTGAAIARDGK